jgi:hypothetical protein
MDLDENNSVTAKYVAGLGTDDIVCMQKNNNEYYYSRDLLNSVVCITDQVGNIVESYEYESFGKPSAVSQNLISKLEDQ